MLKIRISFLTLLLLFFFVSGFSQPSQVTPYKTYKVAIFAPLFLDSVFNGDEYRYSKNFPKFTLPGLDFIQGAQIALDSMTLLNGNIDASFYDSKSYDTPVETLISSHNLDSLDLIIGSVKDQEYIALAEFAQKKNIPFISATYPNDAGVSANPFLVIVNSTLKAHCEAIYSYLLSNHSTEKIFLVRRDGSQEDRVAAYFKSINAQDGKNLLNIQVLNFADGNLSGLAAKLDSTRKNVIIGGSLNEAFAQELSLQCAAINKTRNNLLIGMPNWDGFAFMQHKNKLKEYPVYFTTPYYNGKWDGQSKKIQAAYKKMYKASPSDMAYKGFECVYLFTKLLTHYPNDFMNHLNDYSYKVFNEYNFKPVFLNKKSDVPDYFENKRLYFMKSMNGSISKAW